MKCLLVPTCLAIALLGGPCASATGPAEPDGPTVCADAELVAAVQKPRRFRPGPDAAERLVGHPAVINTTRDDLRILLRANVGGDWEWRTTPDAEPPMPDFEAARHVVYWGRPLPARNPRMVGIAWGRD